MPARCPKAHEGMSEPRMVGCFDPGLTREEALNVERHEGEVPQIDVCRNEWIREAHAGSRACSCARKTAASAMASAESADSHSTTIAPSRR